MPGLATRSDDYGTQAATMKQFEDQAAEVHAHVRQAVDHATAGDYRRADAKAEAAQGAARHLKELLGAAAAQPETGISRRYAPAPPPGSPRCARARSRASLSSKLQGRRPPMLRLIRLEPLLHRLDTGNGPALVLVRPVHQEPVCAHGSRTCTTRAARRFGGSARLLGHTALR
jgi:hypothetical protein